MWICAVESYRYYESPGSNITIVFSGLLLHQVMAIGSGVLIAVIAMGLFHGLEPGHAWPVAGVYALNQRRKWLTGLAGGLLLSIAHILASSALVLVFILVSTQIDLSPFTTLIRAGAGVLLLYLGYRLYTHGHDHDEGFAFDADADDVSQSALSAFQVGENNSLLGLAGFAFLVGFAHEEQLALLSFCAGAGNCLTLVLVYGVAVTVSITTMVLLTVLAYNRVQGRVENVDEYLPLASAVILWVIGGVFLLDAAGVIQFL
jgi:ABC-type nickel/cobalt efflux system permease component RcnA